ncbi:MAG: hypothetical protein JWM27_1239 [Gemmatimonadetes bacterium]|nr:hypothetical protein [Gemmatimonadota bacterium]
MSEHTHEPGLPLEQFITALTSQLDRAQNAMAIKARLGYPLTFAVKELTLDLRTHVEMVGSVVQIRPAGPGETDTSTIHLALTTITRPMMEENTMQLSSQPGEPTLQEALGDKLTEEEKRRLEWAGVQTVSQLVELERHSDPDTLSKIANVPALRLRAALDHASRPMVHEVVPVALPDAPRYDARAGEPSADEAPSGRDVYDRPAAPAVVRHAALHPSLNPSVGGSNPSASLAPSTTPSAGGGLHPSAAPAPAPAATRLLIRGRNLLREGQPQVSIGGRPVRLVRASATELLVEAPHDALSGTLSVETRPGMAFTMELDEGLAVPASAVAPDSRESNASVDRGDSKDSTDATDVDHHAYRNGASSKQMHGSGGPTDAVRSTASTDGRADVWALAPAGYHDDLPAADAVGAGKEGGR